MGEIMWKDIYVPGATGSEGGLILADEEYKETCRITLEKCEKYCAITCGVYGLMAHTAFADFEHGKEKYEAMKEALKEFVDKDTTPDEDIEFVQTFVNQFL